MARFVKISKENIGISPDSLKLRGDKKSDFVKLRVINYNSELIEEKELKTISGISEFDKKGTTSWLNIDGLHEKEIMQDIINEFKLEPLILSDVLNTDSRPKIYEYENCVFISAKMLHYNEKRNLITAENLVLLVKENILITFQEKVGDVFEPVRERLRNNRKRIRSSGSDYLAFALLDVVVDNYIYIVSQIGERIEACEEKLLNNTEKKLTDEINQNKKEINYLRKIIRPAREMLLLLQKSDFELMDEKINVHLKELYDNINLAHDSVESYSELLVDQLNVYNTQLNHKLNDVIKFLTIFSVVFIPLTFIAGVYGTNFDNIPELHFKYGYFIMWGIMISAAIAMVMYFKRKKWL